MPVIKSAVKKLRQDIKRTKKNDDFRHRLDLSVKAAKKSPTPAKISEATSMVDKAVKNNLMHRNKAARIKSSLSKLAKPASKTTTKTSSKPTEKKTTIKAPAKKAATKSKSSKK